MRSISLGKRIRALEQQVTDARAIDAYTEVDKSLAEWEAIEKTITAQEACAIADDLRTNPLAYNSPEMQDFACASGYTAEQCSVILSEALCLQFEVMHSQKNRSGGGTS